MMRDFTGSCPVSCQITKDKHYTQSASAIIFRTFKQPRANRRLPKVRHPWQLYVMALREPKDGCIDTQITDIDKRYQAKLLIRLISISSCLVFLVFKTREKWSNNELSNN